MSARYRFARWYMGRIAGRYCPCEWPVRVKWLMHLCGRIDDLNERGDFYRFCALVLSQDAATSSTSSTSATVKWRRKS